MAEASASHVTGKIMQGTMDSIYPISENMRTK